MLAFSILMLTRTQEAGGMDRFGIGEEAGESDVMQKMMGEREREGWAEVFRGRNTEREGEREREGGREQMTN